MKTLTLLRHAKSGWDDPVARDFDRPLNAKGKRAAAMVGRHMRSLGSRVRPCDRVARGARVGDLGADRIGLWPDDCTGLGSAGVSGFGGYVAGCGPRVSGRGGESVAGGAQSWVGGSCFDAGYADGADPLRDAVEDKYPTASIAELQFEGEWGDVAAGTARLTRFIRPRDLDPTLGPDAD